MQRADDAGRQVRKIWVGKPFDWTFGEWGLAFFVTLATGFLLAFVLPSALIALGGALWAARTSSRIVAPESPRRWFWTVLGLVTVFLGLLRSDPVAWLLPVPFLLALAATPLVGYLVTRKVGRLLDWNRPVAYWIRLPWRFAARPRLTPGEEIDPQALALEASGRDLDRTDLDVRPITTADQIILSARPGDLQVFAAGGMLNVRPVPPKKDWYVPAPIEPADDAMRYALEQMREASTANWLSETDGPPAEPFRVAGYRPLHDRTTEHVLPIPPDPKWVETGPVTHPLSDLLSAPETNEVRIPHHTMPEPPPLPKAKRLTRLDDGGLYIHTPGWLPDFKIGGH